MACQRVADHRDRRVDTADPRAPVVALLVERELNRGAGLAAAVLARPGEAEIAALAHRSDERRVVRRRVDRGVAGAVGAEERVELGPERLGLLAQVEGGEPRRSLEEHVGRRAGGEAEVFESKRVGVDPPEEPRRLVLLEEADRGERVLRAAQHAARRGGRVGDGELGCEQSGGCADGTDADGLGDQQARGGEVDLAIRGAMLDGLEAADRPSELLAGLRVLERELVGTACGTERARDEAETEQRDCLVHIRLGELELFDGLAEANGRPGGDREPGRLLHGLDLA